MSSPILHIKDCYFFEVPKFLWRSQRIDRGDFPDFWVALDEDYLQWEAERFLEDAKEVGLDLHGSDEELLEEYQHWVHADHAHAGKPFATFIKTHLSSHAEDEAVAKETLAKIDEVQAGVREVDEYRESAPAWEDAKIEGYNRALDGKILIPQPFGQIKNLHEPADHFAIKVPLINGQISVPRAGNGLAISKFMIVELVVAVIIAFIFIRLANRMRRVDRPRGRLWNLLETFLVFIRDQIARPAIGQKEGDFYVPLLWTIFLFIVGMNLMGMVPWVGAPTSAFAVTLGMALVTFFTGLIMGSIKFGPVGFWLNQVPSMDLPWYMAIVLKPVVWAIEVLGMLIKHTILGVRLLANMIAGHLVLLGIMTIAFSIEGAASDTWWIAAPAALIGSAIFSLLELFVAFLQAYIFTFLSALFIGAATHHH